jgi:chromate reductase
MAYTPRILAFAGSTRNDSFNKRLVQIAAEGARKSGAEVTYIDLRDLPLPLYDAEVELQDGLPENAQKLKALMLSNEGFLISCPEYNSSISGVLKNAIDWASRSAPGEEYLACFNGKTVGLMSASPGGFGGSRGLTHVRSILGNIGVVVMPSQITIAKAHEAFQPDGSLKDPEQQGAVTNLGAELAEVLSSTAGAAT